MIKLQLPFWNDQNSSESLLKTAQLFWERIEACLRWPLTQLDPLTCTLVVLNLIAWQRDITRIKNEPLNLYRKRVAYAYVNAADAGSTIGIKRIFMRLGVGYIEVEERAANRDWDVIILRMLDSQLAGNAELLKTIIEMYGRTCRRYEFEVITPIDISISTAEFGAAWSFDFAEEKTDLEITVSVTSAEYGARYDFDFAEV